MNGGGDWNELRVARKGIPNERSVDALSNLLTLTNKISEPQRGCNKLMLSIVLPKKIHYHDI